MGDRNRFAAFMTSVGMGALVTSAKTVDAAGEEKVLTAEEFETTVSAAIDSGQDEGHKAGVAAERARFKAVLESDGAKAHMGQAITLLSTTDQTAEQINATLALFPAAAAAAPVTGKETEAAKRIEEATPNPDLGTNADAQPAPSKDAKGISPEVAAMQDRVFAANADANKAYGATAR